MPGRFAFLPYARNEVAANAGRNGSRLGASFDVQITGDGADQGAPLTMQADLRGPGDVVGIAPNQIARFEPAPGQRGVEPHYFPFVEFIDVDLPWRYALMRGSPRQLKPWIALIALTDQEFQTADQGRRPAPRIIVDAATHLPNLSHAWATAHVQVNLDDAGTRTPEQMLAEDPGNGFARLFCLRKLEPRTRYHLFVVPIYEAGRLAGLGQRPGTSTGSSFAWMHTDPAPVELPYYASSELTTDAGTDIEALLRKLRAFKADDGDEPGAPREASADRPGYYPGYQSEDQRFQIQTALRQADLGDEGFKTDPDLAKAMAQTLTEVIAGEGDDPDEDPLVAFPPYGFRCRQETEVNVRDARQGDWFNRLNLDLKFRHAAARGAKVVQDNQDEFAQMAWDQYDAVMEANQKLRQLRTAKELSRRTTARHLDRLAPEVTTVLGEPMQPYVEVEKAGAFVDVMVKAGSPGAFASRGLRRQAAKRPVRESKAPGTVIPSPAIKGDQSLRRKIEPPEPPEPSLRRGTRLTGAAAQFFVQQFGDNGLGPKPRVTKFQVKPLQSKSFSAALSDTLVSLPDLKADFIVKGRTEAEQKSLDPIWRAPRLPVHMADKLKALSLDAILEDIGGLPDNTVALFTENRMFIEAFLVGANHAMNDELRWREFPTDMRGTLFDRFWDRAVPEWATAGADIAPIHEWKKPLGANPNPSNPKGNDAMVLVIKGDIVRKLDRPIVVVNEGAGKTWVPRRGKDYEPVCSGKLGRELVYFGFDLPNARVLDNPDDYRLVIYEPMGRLRFGLDVATVDVRRARTPLTLQAQPFPMAHRDAQVRNRPEQPPLQTPPPTQNIPSWDDLSWSHMDLINGYVDVHKALSVGTGPDHWGSKRTSASLARSFWQKPVAAVMPFSKVLP